MKRDDDTPLTLAIKGTKLELILLLRYHGAKMNFVDSNGNTALFAAVLKRDMLLVDDLVTMGANVNHRNNDGETPLFSAVRSGCRKHMAEYFLSHGADVNVINRLGDNLLSVAYRVLIENMNWDTVSPGHGLRAESYRPISTHAIIRILAPLLENLGNRPAVTSAAESCFGLAMRSDIATIDRKMQSTALLLKHGAYVMPADVMAEVACSEWQSGWWKQFRCSFFTKSFASFLRLAGVNVAGLHQPRLLERVAHPRSKEHMQAFFDRLHDVMCDPLTLQQLSVIAIRSALRMRGGRLWVNIDALPLLKSIKNIVKMKSQDYKYKEFVV